MATVWRWPTDKDAIGEPTRIAELRVFSTERAREFIESSSRMPI